MRRALALVATPLLLLVACGSDDEGAETEDEPTTEADEAASEIRPAPDDAILDAVEVTGEAGAAPTVEFEAPFEAPSTVRRVLEEGDGEPLEASSTATFDYVAFNGRDGAEFDTSYGAEPATAALDQQDLISGMAKGLIGVPVGSRVLVAMAPDDAFGPLGGNAEVGIEAGDTVLFVFDVRDSHEVLERAEGEAVEPPEGLPTVELDEETGEPAITIPDGDPPGELVVQPLIEGEGEPVEANQDLIAHYTGLLWADGSVFDSSWERGQPATFPIGAGQVIPGWDEGLVGQPIGSQVLLVIPPDQGYGPEGNAEAGISGEDTLVFVVDILGAT